jgi:hypothetical protein
VTLACPLETATARTNEWERKIATLEEGTARCEDGSPTTLPWRDTLVEAVVVRTKDGPQLVQLVGAECDQPQWRRWAWAAGQVAKDKGTQVGKHGKC